MKKLFTILIFLLAITGFSQTAIEKSSIDSGGATVSSGSLSMVYTLGEVAVQEMTIGNIHISEGFICAEKQNTLGIENHKLLEGITLFPNPATDYVNFNFTSIANYEILIFDFSGKQIFRTVSKQADQIRLPLKQYSPGVYLVMIKNNEKKLYNSYKLVKE